MIPSIVKVPVYLAQQITFGAVRLGVNGVTTVLRVIRPDSAPDADSGDYVSPPQPRVSTAPVPEAAAPAPRPAAKKAPAKKAPAKKAAVKKAPAPKPGPPKTTAPKPGPPKKAPAKPAATLDEPAAPIDDDPVVYSSGPEVAASVPAEDLEALRTKL